MTRTDKTLSDHALVPLRTMRVHVCVLASVTVMILLPALERVCTWSVAAALLRASASQEHQS
jgi:hypothetical protein